MLGRIVGFVEELWPAIEERYKALQAARSEAVQPSSVVHGGIDRDPLEVLAAQRAGFVRYPQALGQQQLQLVAEPSAPAGTRVGRTLRR